ncbi:MAG: PDZ domain-containing protein [Saprospiraceae bacterium]|nr:PDZ domain-containing protein [Saprospiraceae bacterium]
MKYLLSLLFTLMVVLPNIINAQTNTHAELEIRVKERIERQKEQRKQRKNAEVIRNRVKEFATCPTSAFLGVESNSISYDKAEKLGFDNPHGSYVTKVFKNTAAHAADLKPFDYIVGIDNQETSESEDLTDLLGDYETGDKATVHYIRQGKKRSAKITFGNRENAEWEEPKKEKAFLGISHLANSSCESTGVVVNVVDNSSAQLMGLEDGDIITAINGNPIIDWDDVTTSISNVVPGQKISVDYLRNGLEGSAFSNINSYSESKSYTRDQPKPKYDYKKPEPKEKDFGYAFFGIYTEEISKEKVTKLGGDNPYGSYVTGVIPGAAAEKAGIGKMDYIFGFDEYRTGQNQSLTGILKKYSPGDRAVAHLIRKGKKINSEVTFGSRENFKEAPKDSKKDKCEDTFFGITNAGLGNGNGVKVNVVKNSTAGEMNIQNGDVILTIDGYIMTDWDDISMAIDRLNPGDKITVGFDHNGETTRVCVPIKSYAETKNCKDCNCNEYNYSEKESLEKYENEIALAKGNSWNDRSEGRINLSDVNVKMSAVDEPILTPKGENIRGSNDLEIKELELDIDEDKGLFQLQFELPSSGATAIQFYNSMGRVIYDYDLGQFSGEFEDHIDLAQNGTGDYFLFITQGSKSITRKIELTKD